MEEFQFQINNHLSFRRDEELLKKADACRPEIFHHTVPAVRIAELVSDPQKLNGVGVKESEKQIEHLAEYSFRKGDALILDFGEHCVGKFRIKIDSTGSPMDAPLFMRLKFAEMPSELAASSADYNGWLSRSWIQEEFVHLDVLPAVLELPRRYSFRYAEIRIIDTSPKWQAVFSGPEVITESSADYSRLRKALIIDPELKRIYDTGVKTLADCMQDVFEDGPKRDRRLWLGDLRLQALANYASFDNTDLVRRCLYLFAAMTTEEGKISANVFTQPDYIPDDTFLFEYSLFFISVLYDLNQAHPDPQLVRELYPVCKKQMDLTLGMFDVNGKLIPDPDYPIFTDWSQEFDKETSGQAEVIYVLKQFLALAKEAGEENLEYYETMLDLISTYAKDILYDPERHLFVSGEQEYNIASQVWMVLAHVMDDKTNHEIMETAVSELFPVQGIATPYMYHCIAEALFAAGLYDEAVTLIKDYWGKMIRLGADTFWEAFDPDRPDYSPYGSPIVNSYCHAWSCTPVYLIRKYMLDEKIG